MQCEDDQWAFAAFGLQATFSQGFSFTLYISFICFSKIENCLFFQCLNVSTFYFAAGGLNVNVLFFFSSATPAFPISNKKREKDMEPDMESFK